MKAYAAKYAWMPPVSSVPKRVQRALLPFSPAIKGWTIWYEGKTRTVCSITVPVENVPERWAKLKATIDRELTQAHRPKGGGTLREAISDYFQWLEYRVQTGTVAAASADDYKRYLTEFARFEVAGRTPHRKRFHCDPRLPIRNH